jgi:hypothetical protein
MGGAYSNPMSRCALRTHLAPLLTFERAFCEYEVDASGVFSLRNFEGGE